MSASSIAIYGSPLSQPTRLVMWTAKLLDLPYEFKRVDAGKGEQKSAAFLQLNPNAVFPVLVDQQDGQFVVWESNAIARYLCAKAASTKQPMSALLYPVHDAKQTAQVDQWLDWKHGALREGCAGVVRRQVMAKMVGKQHSMFQTFDEVKPEREVRQLLSSLAILNTHLATTTSFLVPGTSHPTLADLAVFEEVEQLSMLPQQPAPPAGGNLAQAFPHVVQWQQRVRQTLQHYGEVHKELVGAAKKLEEMRNKPAAKL